MRKGERKKQDIIQAATALFFQKGYDATTVQDILDALNTSKGSFYHHFDAKLDVLVAIAEEHAGQNKLTYQSQQYDNVSQALNGLLRQASPLKSNDASLLVSLAGMQSPAERAVLWDAMVRAACDAFYDEFASLLWTMKQLGTAVWQGEESLQAAFVSFFTACKLLVDLPHQHQNDAALQALPMIRAIRRQTERLLGLQAGSIVIVDIEEILLLLRQVWQTPRS